jgi:hypothetical protein
MLPLRSSRHAAANTTPTMQTRNLAALIEGGLQRTAGFTPTPENKSMKDHVQWLEHRLEVAQIPLLNMKYVVGFSPYTFILEAGCCIATFREQCHNSGLRFARANPLNGTSVSCWVEVEIKPEL